MVSSFLYDGGDKGGLNRSPVAQFIEQLKIVVIVDRIVKLWGPQISEVVPDLCRRIEVGMPEGGRSFLLSPDLGETIQPPGYQEATRFQQTIDLFKECIDILRELKQGDGRNQFKPPVGKGEMRGICFNP
jgi:hypothetical protein